MVWIHKATNGIKLHGTKLSRKKQELLIVVKNLPANAGDIDVVWFQSLSQEDHLEEGMAIHSSILARKLMLVMKD